MGRIWSAAGLAAILVAAAVSAPVAFAADFPYSTHRLQLQDDPSPEPVEGPIVTVADDKKKNVGRGVMFSLIIPGAGQLYSGSWARAIPWFAVEVAGWALFANYHGKGKDKTSEFEKFAGQRRVGFSQPQEGNFDVNAYLYREYQIASSPTYNATPYSGNLDEWIRQDWSFRDDYLQGPVIGFTHDVLTPDIQQYFEMIGKYLNQFGFGWMDMWSNADIPRDNNGIYRFDQLGSGADIWWADDQQSVGFDFDDAPAGFSPRSTMFYQYRDMRGEANDLLDKGNIAMEVVLVNHVLSALDAAFAVRRHNKRVEEGHFGQMKLQYEVRPVDGQLARFMTMSVPIR